MSDTEEPALAEPPARDARSHILYRLDDDCLREIFESAALALLDLVTLTTVCRRFSPIAARAIETEHTNFKNFPLDVIPSDWPFEEYLQTFGASIEGFGAVRLNGEECLLALEHCTRLRHLKCNIRDDDTPC